MDTRRGRSSEPPSRFSAPRRATFWESLVGTDKLTIFVLNSGYSVLRTTQTRIAVGVVVETWGDTR
jgi:hypothetical protein